MSPAEAGVDDPFRDLEPLVAAGRLEEAAAVLKSAAASGASPRETQRWLERLRLELARRRGADPRQAEAAWFDGVLEAAEAGGYTKPLESAVLQRVARARRGEKLLVEWHKVFCALMCAQRYDDAFRLGEAVLDRPGAFLAPSQLMWPWMKKVGRAVSEGRFMNEELFRVRAAGRRGRFRPWYAYYRALLAGYAGKHDEGMLDHEPLRRLPGRRYAWMRQAFVLPKLEGCDYQGAAAEARAVLRHYPDNWWVRCRMAEAYLAAGRTDQGLAALERAARTADATARREVLTWHGEVLLWLGRYAEAVARLDEAISLGTSVFAYGWRGAARLKLGELDAALADLDRAVELDAKDFEARLWRAEAYRLQGRFREAVRECDRLVAARAGTLWTYFNRALARDALGEPDAMAADYMTIPMTPMGKEVLELIEGELRLTGRPLGADEIRAALQAGLERAKGVRRWESYVQAVWMGAR